MIDIETLGKAPDGAIIQVGVVQFEEKILRSYGFDVKPLPQQTLDYSTVRWWMEQVKSGVAFPRRSVVSLEHLLTTVLPRLMVEPCEVWAKPPSFDLVMLEWAYRAIGVKPPWSFRAHRCVRTLAQVCADKGGLVADPVGTHNAKEDAEAQAEWVIDMQRALGILR